MASSSTQKPSSSSSSSSSSSAPTGNFNFDVFLSFRGEDTRYNFTDHLFVNLDRMGFNTFRDDKLERGEEIAPELLRTIEGSRFSIIVFSEKYADSKWCLDELTKIMECRAKKDQIVLPVFYHVDPSDVRRQTGSFGKAFADHETTVDEKKVQRWRAAMNQASSLSGWHVVKNEYETKVIKAIIDEVNKILNPGLLDVGKNIVGMSSHLEKMRLLMNIELKEVRVIGICGIGGIGKTTIAKAIYNEISYQYEGSSFLINVKERSKGNMVQLQQEFLHDILKEKSTKGNNIYEGINMIKRSLRSKRVLVVFDDVDDWKQLEYLVQERGWFTKKSRVIITTRNKQLLAQYKVDALYEVEKLNHAEATELFSLWAFGQNLPKEKYKDFSYNIIDYAKGLPLALKVLGAYLSDEDVNGWKSALCKLKTIPNKEIHDVLKISFDGLDDMGRGIFLDIACFFKGEDRTFVSRILGPNAENGIRDLHNKCLITILGRKLDMHALVQQMGWEIIRQQYPTNLGKQSRLWKPNDVYDVLMRNMGTDRIEGIFLNVSILKKQIEFMTKAFKMMNGLRLLKIHQDAKYGALVESQIAEDGLKVQLFEDFEFPSHNLTYLHWDGYPLEYFSSNFQVDNLVELSLRYSKIKRLWKVDRPLEKLKVIDLSYSKHLIEIPSFSRMPNLEILTLEGCIKLEGLPSDIYKLKYLQTLCCRHCSKLKRFPEIKGNMENLRELYLSYTSIEELPSSIKHLKGIECLDLTNCKSLESVPNNICSLESLKTLHFGGCSRLYKLPGDLESLKCLEELYLSGISCQLPPLLGLCSLRVLYLSDSILTNEVIQSNNCWYSMKTLIMPNCNIYMEGLNLDYIFRLSSLEKLDLSNCNMMKRRIPNYICHLSSLQALDLSRTAICSIPDGISQLSQLNYLGLSHCKNLQSIPELPSSLRLLDAHNCTCLETSPSFSWQRRLWRSLHNCFQSDVLELEWSGSRHNIQFGQSDYLGQGICMFVPRLPEWITYQAVGNEVIVELPMNWYDDNDFQGFALWVVYVPFGDAPAFSWRLGCQLSISGDQFEFLDILLFSSHCHCHPDGISNVWIMYYPQKAIQEKYRSNQWRQFKALFTDFHGCSEINCGVRLMYAQQTHLIHGTCIECDADMQFQKKLCFGGTVIKELSTNWHSFGFDSLCLRNCKNLESLPSSICKFKSLVTLSCSGCSNLKSFPEIWENMEVLRELYLDRTSIEVLPSSIEHLSRLEVLNLRDCKNLVNLPESNGNLSFLKNLTVTGCSRLVKLPENLGRMQQLEKFYATSLDSLICQLPSLSGLCYLRILHLGFSKLMQGSILDLHLFCPLMILDLSYCNLEVIPSEIFRLSSLQALYLGGNHFCSISSELNQLYNLRLLDLSHCQKLLQIPELPSSLRVLDAHHCTGLETLSSPSSLLWSSLFKCFKSTILDLESKIRIPEEILQQRYSGTGLSIVIPASSTIPEWIKHWRNGSRISHTIPQFWDRKNNFLGFALYFVCVPLDNESKDKVKNNESWSLKCELTLDGFFSKNESWSLEYHLTLVDTLRCTCRCGCNNDDVVSKQVWVIYYPKVAMKEHFSEEQQWLNASFHGHFGSKPIEVEECGIRLIYAQDYEQNHEGQEPVIMIHGSCSHVNLGDHISSVEDTNGHDQRSYDNTEGTERNHPPTMQCIDDKVLSTQDDEQNHMPYSFDFLTNFGDHGSVDYVEGSCDNVGGTEQNHPPMVQYVNSVVLGIQEDAPKHIPQSLDLLGNFGEHGSVAEDANGDAPHKRYSTEQNRVEEPHHKRFRGLETDLKL